MPQTVLSAFLPGDRSSQTTEEAADANALAEIASFSDYLSDASDTTPTLPAPRPPSIKTLEAANKALDEAKYQAALATVSRDDKITINGRHFVKTSALRTSKCVTSKKAWYWSPSLGIEILQTCKWRDSKGICQRNIKYWMCIRCKQLYNILSTPANREKHLKNEHHIYKPKESTTDTPSSSFSDDPPDDPDRGIAARVSKALVTTICFEKLKSALLFWIVICHIKLSIVEDGLFMEFIKILSPHTAALIPLAGNTIRNWITEAYHGRKQRIIDSIARSKSCINISFDLWTSPNHLALMGIVAHYIDVEGKMTTVGVALVFLI